MDLITMNRHQIYRLQVPFLLNSAIVFKLSLFNKNIMTLSQMKD
jgi:hypothetical protein